MSEDNWARSTDPDQMLKFLQDSGLLSERKARLFACACCRLVWQLLGERDHGAVEVAERFADGLASHEQLEAARETFRDWNSAATYQCNAAWATTHISAWDAAKGMSFFVTPLPRWHARRSGSQVQWATPSLDTPLRDLFGPLPFRPLPPLPPSVRTWNDGFIVKLATTIYEERSLPSGQLDPHRLAVLGDALEEAGCTDPDILGHLRQQGAVHVRGCWCVDLLLAKE